MAKNIKIAICDDDKTYINRIIEVVSDIAQQQGRICEIETSVNGKNLIKKYKDDCFDAVFLDIDMPDMSGFEVAEKLRAINQNVIIVFITSHEDKVYQSWVFQPFWFVRKSHMDDLNIVLPKLFIKIDSEREKEYFIFKLNLENKTIDINIHKVKYIQAHSHYILIKDGTQEQKIRCKIAEAEQQLSRMYFVRVQNSVLVNCRFISRITSRKVILNNGEEINISRDKIEYVKNEFQKFLRSR